MSGETDFLNDALGQIGADRITGIDDGTINGNYCQTFWPALRRAILREHFWNFAEARAKLAQSTTPPAFEFVFSYTLPENFLRLKEYNGANLLTASDTELLWIYKAFKIEQRNLFTNDGDVFVVYVKDIPDMSLWDSLAYQGASTWLASKLALAISKDSKKSVDLLGLATSILMPLARAVDGQEMYIQPIQSDSLTRGR